MQYVGIYDKNGYVAEQIKSMKFWSVRNDFELTEIIHDKNEISGSILNVNYKSCP